LTNSHENQPRRRHGRSRGTDTLDEPNDGTAEKKHGYQNANEKENEGSQQESQAATQAN
jgi:hypothetical protein